MIFGVTGTNGSGKGEVVRYLEEEKGFKHYSVRAYLTEEIIRRGLPVNRTNMRLVSNDLRRTYRHDYYSTMFIEDAEKNGITDYLMESVRHMAEADNIRKHGGFIIAVDADKKLRYERVVLRGTETDKVSFEEFVIQEDAEMTGSGEEQNMGEVMASADFRIMNEGTLEELHLRIEEVLAEAKQRI